ncbi:MULTISPECIES: SAF domain-containing protein [unclassified Isoptericola]|uniref:SAF domain-containing protein n=1 Tax=unclassified Isoptericola TaxID=2623355 RepID=UPI003659DC73
MTNTITRDTANQDPAPALGPPPKLRRRPTVIAIGLVVALVSSLLVGWMWMRANDRVEVLVAASDVPRGEVIDATDLRTARINLDPAITPLAADRADDVVGQRAATDMVTGSLLTDAMLETETLPADGSSLVPAALPAELAAGLDLQAGDRVKVVLTGPAGQEAVGNPTFTPAEVAGVDVSPETGGTVVSLLVPEADGPVLAARIAAGNFYLVLDTRER